MWNPNRVEVESLIEKGNWMARLAKSINNETRFQVINVYGLVQTNKKRESWRDIDAFFNNNDFPHTIIGGDFNVILHLSEKKGGIQRELQAHTNFSNWVSRNNLLDIKRGNVIFTWNNKRKGFNNIAEKLDSFSKEICYHSKEK